jgi:hypothetical protein
VSFILDPVRASAVPLVEIVDVEPIPMDGLLDGRSIETPQPESAVDTYVLPISGWVHSSSATARAVHVVAEGRAIASGPVRFPRPDVAAHFAIADHHAVGFMTDVNVLGLPASFELTLEVELEDGIRLPFMAVRGRRRPLQPKVSGTMQPIFVTNVGRCGSTVMMNLLRCHPRIVVHDLYPYETRALGYWVHMLKVLSEPANHKLSANPNTYEDDPFWVGRHPHNMRPVIGPAPIRDWLRRDYVDSLASFCMQSTEDFYQSVRVAQEVVEPVYFAEKRNPRPASRITSELYPDGREIFLVREPRDMVCSMISFYEKTQLVSFGRDQGGTEEEFVDGIAQALRELVTQISERGEQSIVVRYEDMIADMPGTLERVLAYLQLDTDASVRDTIVARSQESTSSSRRHRTTASADASVGRWRRDLDESMQTLCNAAFADLIPELGYEL